MILFRIIDTTMKDCRRYKDYEDGSVKSFEHVWYFVKSHHYLQTK
jgi:hypothetical protein